jgi:uncharacterized protein YnzC (UPF0291/DUF896 family)
MEYSQKFSLVHFLTVVEPGTEFKMDQWPMHVTLADVFAIDLEGTDVMPKLRKFLKTQARVRTTALLDAVLGTTAVTLLENNQNLSNLHSHVIDLLETYGAVFNMPEYNKSGFLPHATVQANGRLNASDKVNIDSLALIDMFPGNDWQNRKVVTTFNLSAF